MSHVTAEHSQRGCIECGSPDHLHYVGCSRLTITMPVGVPIVSMSENAQLRRELHEVQKLAKFFASIARMRGDQITALKDVLTLRSEWLRRFGMLTDDGTLLCPREVE